MIAMALKSNSKYLCSRDASILLLFHLWINNKNLHINRNQSQSQISQALLRNRLACLSVIKPAKPPFERWAEVIITHCYWKAFIMDFKRFGRSSGALYALCFLCVCPSHFLAPFHSSDSSSSPGNLLVALAVFSGIHKKVRLRSPPESARSKTAH